MENARFGALVWYCRAIHHEGGVIEVLGAVFRQALRCNGPQGARGSFVGWSGGGERLANHRRSPPCSACNAASNQGDSRTSEKIARCERRAHLGHPLRPWGEPCTSGDAVGRLAFELLGRLGDGVVRFQRGGERGACDLGRRSGFGPGGPLPALCPRL